MKRIKIRYALYTLFCLTALLAVSCKNDSVADFQLNANSRYLSIGDSLQLGYMKVEPEDKDFAVTWSSSNNAVAMVDDKGLVIAKSEGQAVISSVSGNESAHCDVHVVKYGFRNATIFDTETEAEATPNRFHLVLSTNTVKRMEHPTATPSGVMLILDLTLPEDSTNITSGRYPLLTDGVRTPGFFAGERKDGKTTGSYLVDRANNDTLLITGGEFSVSIPDKYFILGELDSESGTLGFFYEGAIPQKTLNQKVY